jgi:hypothetical protein
MVDTATKETTGWIMITVEEAVAAAMEAFGAKTYRCPEEVGV